MIQVGRNIEESNLSKFSVQQSLQHSSSTSSPGSIIPSVHLAQVVLYHQHIQPRQYYTSSTSSSGSIISSAHLALVVLYHQHIQLRQYYTIRTSSPGSILPTVHLAQVVLYHQHIQPRQYYYCCYYNLKGVFVINKRRKKEMPKDIVSYWSAYRLETLNKAFSLLEKSQIYKTHSILLIKTSIFQFFC